MYVYQCLYLLIMFLFIILFKEIGAVYYGSVTELKYNFYCTLCAQDDALRMMCSGNWCDDFQ